MENRDLHKVFTDLGINLGSITSDNISAWYETNCEDTLNALNWLATFVNKDNVLSGQEQVAYESLKSNNALLKNEAFEHSVEEIENNYPGIFDADTICFEVECLEDQMEICVEDLRQVENIIEQNKDLNKQIKKAFSKLSDEELSCRLKKDNVQYECLTLAQRLEDVNKGMQMQVNICSEMLSPFEDSPNPTYLSSISIEDVELYIDEIGQSVKTLITNDAHSFNKSDATGMDTILNDTGVEPILEEMQNRVARSYCRSIFYKSQMESLEALLKYCNKLDLYELSTRSLQGNSLHQLEALLISKQEQLHSIESELESTSQEAAKKWSNLPKLSLLQKAIDNNVEKNNFYKEIDHKLNEIVNYVKILRIMFQEENKSIRTIDKYFRETFEYIAYPLTYCDNRNNLMAEMLSECEIYKAQPFEQRYKLLEAILTIITEKEHTTFTFKDVIKAVDRFRNECNSVEQKIFIDDFTQFRSDCKLREKYLREKKRLFMGSTSTSMIIIPNEAYYILEGANKKLKLLETDLAKYMQLPQHMKERFKKNKYLLMRRYLWMYFYITPKNVLACIDNISQEVRKLQSAQLSKDFDGF